MNRKTLTAIYNYDHYRGMAWLPFQKNDFKIDSLLAIPQSMKDDFAVQKHLVPAAVSLILGMMVMY